MAQLRVYTLLGDSTIRNHVTKTSMRANPVLKDAQIIACGHVGLFTESISQVRENSTVVILSCFTSFVAGASIEGTSTVSQRVDPLLQDIKALLVQRCDSHPDVSFLLSPPMYRQSPIWYREGLPEIMTLFSQVFSTDRPANLSLLPSFSTPEFVADGVQLTLFSGQEFIMHLFDSSHELLERLGQDLPITVQQSSESTRVLEDRVMALEQDHRRLNRVVEHKIAVDAELDDFRENERLEDCFVIAGLERISSELVGKEWQDLAMKHVKAAITSLMGRALPVIVVHNSTRRVPGAEVTYTVKMANVKDSKSIRTKFGSFFVGAAGTDRRPPPLKGISIKNRVTPETHVRISILKLIAKGYRESNPGSRVKVIGYEPRPLFKVTPSTSATDRRTLSYNFVEAVKKLPSHFTQTELEPIMKRMNPELVGRIRSLFIILSDDQFKRRSDGAPRATASSAEAEIDATPEAGDIGPEVIDAAPSEAGSQARGSKRPASPATSAPNNKK